MPPFVLPDSFHTVIFVCMYVFILKYAYTCISSSCSCSHNSKNPLLRLRNTTCHHHQCGLKMKLEGMCSCCQITLTILSPLFLWETESRPLENKEIVFDPLIVKLFLAYP